MAGIDINRTTSGISLPKSVSSEVWGLTINQSAVMRAARQITLPGSGIQIDTLNGVGGAAWVNETAEKPVGSTWARPSPRSASSVASTGGRLP